MGSRRPDEAPIPTIGNAGVSSGLEEDSDRPTECFFFVTVPLFKRRASE